MENSKHFLIFIAVTIFLNLNSVCCDKRHQNCANKTLHAKSGDEIELGAKIDKSKDGKAFTDGKICAYEIKGDDHGCIYMAQKSDEALFKNYEKSENGYLEFVDMAKRYEVVFVREER